MAVGSAECSSWICEVEGDFAPVFDNFIMSMMTPSPDEVIDGNPGDLVDHGIFSISSPSSSSSVSID
jgi:hypothetical protein